MDDKGLKADFASDEAQPADPKVLLAYARSMQQVLPQIIAKVRESERLAASIPLSRTFKREDNGQS